MKPSYVNITFGVDSWIHNGCFCNDIFGTNIHVKSTRQLPYYSVTFQGDSKITKKSRTKSSEN